MLAQQSEPGLDRYCVSFAARNKGLEFWEIAGISLLQAYLYVAPFSLTDHRQELLHEVRGVFEGSTRLKERDQSFPLNLIKLFQVAYTARLQCVPTISADAQR